MPRKWDVDTSDHDDASYQMGEEYINARITAEWSYEELQSKYQNLKKVTIKNFPTLWFGLEFAISVKTILNVKGVNLPFIGIILGPPSSLKTFIVELFRHYYKYTFYTDKFSARSLVSHNSSMSDSQLKKIDLLPKIRNKLFLTPELSPMFSVKDEDLNEILGILTRVADGQGYESDSGVQGHRGYSGTMMYAWLGAAVDIPRKVFRLLGTLGPKLYFFRMPWVPVTEDEYLDSRNEDFNAKKKEVEIALLEYLFYFPAIILEEETLLESVIWSGKENGDGKLAEAEAEEKCMLPKIQMHSEADDIEAHRAIIKLGKMLAHLRAVVPTYSTPRVQGGGTDYTYGLPMVEDPGRAITVMRSLAKGHALSQGRAYINLDDIPIVAHMAFSTTTLERVRLFELLIEHGGTLTTPILCESLNISPPTARNTMTELKVAGLVDLTGSEEEEKIHGITMGVVLKNEFEWFLSEDFTKIRKALLKEKYTRRARQKRE
jgi:hypothetical protein